MPLEDLAYYLNERTSGKLAEIGVGFQFKVALTLRSLGRDVFVVDWNSRAVERARELGITAFRDDVFNPRFELYTGVGAIYAVRPTPEIIKPILELGRKLKVPVIILPLSGDTMPGDMKLENYRGLAIYSKGI